MHLRKKAAQLKRGLAVSGDRAPSGITVTAPKKRLILPTTKEEAPSTHRAFVPGDIPTHEKDSIQESHVENDNHVDESKDRVISRPATVPVLETEKNQSLSELTTEELKYIKQSYLGLNTR